MNKKVSVVLLLLLLAIPVVFADVEVKREDMTTAEEGKPHTVRLTITTDRVDAPFDLHEFTPEGWDISSWEVEGYSKANIDYEAEDQFYQGKERTGNHWTLTRTFAGTVTITYQVTPEEAGVSEFLTAWTYPGGFNSRITRLSVLPSEAVAAMCGNGICDIGETEETCPEDCAAPILAPGIKFPSISIGAPELKADVTLIVIAIILGGFIFAGVMVYTKAKKSFAELAIRKAEAEAQAKKQPVEQVAVEDLRAFVKLGLKRGYTLRQMANALKGSQIDTRPFRQIAQEEMMKTMDRKAKLREKEMKQDDKYIKKLKKVMSGLKGKK